MNEMFFQLIRPGELWSGNDMATKTGLFVSRILRNIGSSSLTQSFQKKTLSTLYIKLLSKSNQKRDNLAHSDIHHRYVFLLNQKWACSLFSLKF